MHEAFILKSLRKLGKWMLLIGPFKIETKLEQFLAIHAKVNVNHDPTNCNASFEINICSSGIGLQKCLIRM